MRPTSVQLAKNAFELLSRVPQHGLGSKLSRTSWTDDCFWTISKVRLSPDGKHGSAWGMLTWRGQPQRPEAPAAQIAGPLKKVWRLVDSEATSQQQQWQSVLAGTLRQERLAAKAATAEGEAQPAAAEQSAA